MKTPKIGDIVLFCENLHSDLQTSIVTKVFDGPPDEPFEVELFTLTPNIHVQRYFYSAKPRYGYWSWPEEEKPIEAREACLYCAELEAKIEQIQRENPANKAEELIDKVSKLSSLLKVSGYDYNSIDFIHDVDDLIQQYRANINQIQK